MSWKVTALRRLLMLRLAPFRRRSRPARRSAKLSVVLEFRRRRRHQLRLLDSNSNARSRSQGSGGYCDHNNLYKPPVAAAPARHEELKHVPASIPDGAARERKCDTERCRCEPKENSHEGCCFFIRSFFSPRLRSARRAQAQNYPWCAYYGNGNGRHQLRICQLRTMHGRRQRHRRLSASQTTRTCRPAGAASHRVPIAEFEFRPVRRSGRRGSSRGDPFARRYP